MCQLEEVGPGAEDLIPDIRRDNDFIDADFSRLKNSHASKLASSMRADRLLGQ